MYFFCTDFLEISSPMWLNTQGVLVPSFPDFMVNFNNWQGLFQIRFVPNFRNCLIGYYPKNDLFINYQMWQKKFKTFVLLEIGEFFFQGKNENILRLNIFIFIFLFSAFGWNFAPKQDNGSSHPLVWWRNSQCIQMVGFYFLFILNLNK